VISEAELFTLIQLSKNKIDRPKIALLKHFH